MVEVCLLLTQASLGTEYAPLSPEEQRPALGTLGSVVAEQGWGQGSPQLCLWDKGEVPGVESRWRVFPMGLGLGG